MGYLGREGAGGFMALQTTFWCSQGFIHVTRHFVYVSLIEEKERCYSPICLTSKSTNGFMPWLHPYSTYSSNPSYSPKKVQVPHLPWDMDSSTGRGHDATQKFGFIQGHPVPMDCNTAVWQEAALPALARGRASTPHQFTALPLLLSTACEIRAHISLEEPVTSMCPSL